MLRAMVCSCASSSADSSRPVNTTTGTSDSAASSLDLLQHLEAGHVGQAQIEHDAVERLLAQSRQRVLARCRRCRSRCRREPSSSRDAHLLGRIVLDDQQPLAARRGVFLDARERRVDAFGRGRLGDEREGAARQRVLAVLVERDDLHRDVPRQRVLLELAEHRPAQHVGQEHVERDRGRLELLGQVERIGAAHRDQHLEALVAREVHDDAGVVRIVLDDQQDACRRAAMSSAVVRESARRGRSVAAARPALLRQRCASAPSVRTRPVGPTYFSGR